MESAKLDVKHRVALPKSVRGALDLRPGDRYSIEMTNGDAILRKHSGEIKSGG